MRTSPDCSLVTASTSCTSITRNGIGRQVNQPSLKFVTVHRVENGKITLWKDYWDMGALANHAPPTWMEDFANADMSWVFDATGLI